MKAALVALVASGLLSTAHAGRGTSPVSKVVDLLSDLQAKIIREGKDAQTVYEEFAEWCEDRSKNVGFEIHTSKSQAADLHAQVQKEDANIEVLEGKIEDISGEISKRDRQLKDATDVRKQANDDFKAEEKQLMDAISVLERSVTILERDGSRPSLLQAEAKTASGLAEALNVIVGASALNAADSQVLTALAQSNTMDEYLGAPAANVYENHSDDIISTLEGLREKAESQLAEARKAEANDLNNFRVMAQHTEDMIKFSTKELGEAKAQRGSASERRSGAMGDLTFTRKTLAASVNALEDLHRTCMDHAIDFEDETKSRGNELKALAEAKKAITDMTGGAADLSYGLNQEGGASLMQVASGSFSPSRPLRALHLVRQLAERQRSPALAQLQDRLSAILNDDTSGDKFTKVIQLISQLIERLEKEGAAGASHKAYCDKEMAFTKYKKEDQTDEAAKLQTKIESMSSRSDQLKDEVAALQKQLSQLFAANAEMITIRQREAASYQENMDDVKQGLVGVRLALKILRGYYGSDGTAHAAADGTASGIVGLLEVVESDFTKSSTSLQTSESAAISEFKQQSKENEVLKAGMEQDVRYKKKETMELDRSVAEATSDRGTARSELDAINEYFEKLKDQCIAQAEPYTERKQRREREIAGLREALEIMSGESVFLQTGSARRLRRRQSS